MNETNLTVVEHHLSLTADPKRLKIIASAILEHIYKYELRDTTLSDFCFNLEVAYQSEMGLEEDDWGFSEQHIP